MTFIKIKSAQISGISALGIDVEVDISNGLFIFQIIGLANKAVEESRERVLSAIRNTFDINPRAENNKITVSLTPATIHKDGSFTDIAIALGYILNKQKININLDKKLFIGELSLSGEILPVKGVVPIILWAKENGFEEVYIPRDNLDDANIVKGIDIFLMTTLLETVRHLTQETSLKKVEWIEKNKNKEKFLDIGQIQGQEHAKRALTIAAAGGHNAILYGPPGTGKTMLAKAFQGITPDLTEKDFLEVAKIYSSVGLFEKLFHKRPPMRSPHHSSSRTSILGGGSIIRPGEITLSHKGILYLDEFLEFESRLIQSLRESLEEGYITISRSSGTIKFPAQYTLLGSMNPCPCGYKGSKIKSCKCTHTEINKYQKKLSGPIVDRIDIWISVNNIDYDLLHNQKNTNDTLRVRGFISDIQKLQIDKRGKLNKNLSLKEISNPELIEEDAINLLKDSATKLKLSPRSYIKTLKVARTIADIEKSEKIKTPHIMESLQYRKREF